MTEVIIAGIGQTPVGEHWETSLRDLAVAAIRDALKDSSGLNPQALFVGNMLAPNLSNQAHLGALIAEYAGLTGIEAITLEASGASGGAALRQGYLAIASGMVDVALVVGVEKFTDKIGPDMEEATATESDADFESIHGMTITAQAALLMKRYMHENNVPENGFAGFALTAHANGVANKNAAFRKAIKAKTYAKAEVVSDPLKIFDMAPHLDGAAALVLTRRELISSNWQGQPVKIAGSAASSDTLALHDRKDMLYFDTAQISAGKAMKQAGIVLNQINFFEYHDVFNIYAALQLEAIGFAIKGQGWRLAEDGEISLKGRIPCATMGGMKARGFAGGASGVYQAVEAVTQLRGQAGANQIAGAKFGLIQSLGGPASTAVSHILQKLD
ncbi:MAG: thiolase domain-containing protein [Anaerolineales bacterium]|nr:thiolase domain-containing protein [Anaerolineales bacterium]